MAAASDTRESIEVPAGGHGDGHAKPGVMDVSILMMFWTWLTFGILAYILYKYAWNPILASLDSREASIRKSVEEAEEIKQKLEEIDSTRNSIIEQADGMAKDIVTLSRKAGMEAERVIQEKAKVEASILMENAKREIQAAEEKAAAELKRQSVDSAIFLAGKLIGENLDTVKNRALTDQLIEKI